MMSLHQNVLRSLVVLGPGCACLRWLEGKEVQG